MYNKKLFYAVPNTSHICRIGNDKSTEEYIPYIVTAFYRYGVARGYWADNPSADDIIELAENYCGLLEINEIMATTLRKNKEEVTECVKKLDVANFKINEGLLPF